MKKNPDPEVFARAVLWKLSQVQAGLATLESQLQEFIFAQTNASREDQSRTRKLWSERKQKLADQLLRAHLAEAGLQLPPNNHR